MNARIRSALLCSALFLPLIDAGCRSPTYTWEYEKAIREIDATYTNASDRVWARRKWELMHPEKTLPEGGYDLDHTTGGIFEGDLIDTRTRERLPQH
ncbi:MAG: hypothetical protein FJ225_02835 [Lentisphaerae bacterium]|nr:hypothetical protein [Lentisphaerota bacterium]